MTLSKRSLAELQKCYREGTISKAEFISEANLLHQLLWQYLPHLCQSEVTQICLTRDDVQFVMGEDNVRLWAPKAESRVAPLEALNFLAYEPVETRVMDVLAEGASCIVDVGANIGYHALRLAMREPQATVHAFEPLPQTMEYLQRNVALNSLGSRVRTYNHGLSNTNAICDFFIAPDHGVNASLMNVASRDNARRVTCSTLTMDQWASHANAIPDFIKIDVEGAELLVLQGAQDTISKSSPKIFAEMLRKWAAPFGYHPNDVISFMATLGYACWGVGMDGVHQIALVTDQTVETNYVFLHPEHHAVTISRLISS